MTDAKHEAPAEGAGEMRPCPFCGSTPRYDIGRVEFVDAEVSCGACGASGPNINTAERAEDNLSGAIAAWNLRARSSAPEAREGEAWPERWSGPCTVGNMISNLRTLPPEMPLYSAYHIPRDDQPSLLKVKRPTLSRERVDGTNIKTGDKSIPYSAVIWSQPRDPEEAHPAAPSADKLREVLVDLTSWFTKPVQGQSGMVWVIPAGERGADDALNAALAALKAEV